ncbi:MAG: DUF4956 domain-containing protein [Anaeroplasmataceae bacterium]
MNLFKSIIDAKSGAGDIIICLALTIIMAVLFGVVFCLVKRHDGYAKDIPLTYAILPVVICAITLAITMIVYKENLNETSSRYERVLVALLAGLIMIRFRSSQRTTEELTYIFFLTVIGIIIGMGYIYFGILTYLLVLVLFILLYYLKYPIMSKRNLNIKVTIPEDLNYEHAFDDIFLAYTKHHQLTKVKTSDMGTMFVLNYEVVMKDGKSTKDFIDLIRQRNGNLNVVLTVKKYTQIE